MPSPLSAVLAILVAGPAEIPAEAGGVEMAQLTIHQRIVIRVPRMPAPRSPAAATPAPPMVWEEKGAPKCLAMNDLAGALITRPDSVDLVMAGGKRFRAHLEDDCPALDFYSGFYLKPTKDGKICQDRDSVRSRSGGKCRIDRFRSLRPKR